MRALAILHERIGDAMGFMHAARWGALWAASHAVLRGGRLWLTAMGRSRPGNAAAKHSIKAIDRLLGSPHLHRELTQVYAVMAALVLGKTRRPVILVDTVEVAVGAYALTAAVACQGRGIPILSIVTDKGKPRAGTLQEFLSQLEKILPDGSRPILVTDAGFENPWFQAVEAMDWDYVGRLRNRTQFLFKDEWVSVKDLHRLATKRSKSLGSVAFPRRNPTSRRLVLSKRPKSKHRQRMTRRGGPGQRTQDAGYRRGANEPWLLATTLSSNAANVVDIYASRMQIEETFRDVKNHRWGWSLRHCRSRSHARLETLVLVASLAYLVQYLIGFAAEQCNLHHRHQANTVRDRRVLSLFVLGGLILESRDWRRLSAANVRASVVQLHAQIHAIHAAPR